MGRVASSLVKRPLRNQAQRPIDRQDRPSTSPMPPSSKGHVDAFNSEHPEILDELVKKNPALDKMLEGLVVNPQKFGAITSKKRELPGDRSKSPDLEFGYLEPDVIRPGRCTIRQAMEFLGNHHSDPENYSAVAIAKQYNLNETALLQVLRYFSIFLVQIPRQTSAEPNEPLTEAKAFKPSFLKKQLDSGKNSESNKFSQPVVSSPETK